MLRRERHGDVERLVLASPTGRAVGYDVSVYLVRDVLVDTAFPRAWPALAQALDARAAAGRPVRGAIVTHQHEDHAGNVGALAGRGVPLALSSETRAAIRAPAPIGLYRLLTWGAMRGVAATAAPLALDETGLALVPTPGHTDDHQAVWDASTETLFGGDLFLGVKVRVAHDDENPRALARSLRAAAALRPRRLFCAHRGPVPDPVRALEAKAGWVEDTIAEIERLTDAGWSERRVRDAVLGREGMEGFFSAGDYSKLNLVRTVLRTR